MPRYDAAGYDPPAPVTDVTLRPSGENSPTVPNVRMLIDTGADVTLLPRAAVARLGVHARPGTRYELVGFDGNRTFAEVVELDMIFLNKVFRGRYLLIDADHGILGRDVLAAVAMLFDGPKQEWSAV